jgi:ABC-2 type transport system ATP-binding protein
MSLLEVEHLRKSFGRLVAVDDVSFRVEAGEIFGLLGPNGAGKSTTMMMLAGLIEPDAGTVRIDGQTLDRANRGPLRTLGVAPQDLARYPDLTARENLRVFGRLYGLRGDLLDERIETVLERTGLAARADDLAGEYSGGMKRRLNFGIALLHRPRLLILDEPTVGVDPQSRNAILESVEALSDEGMAVLYTTHYMEEAERLCDRVGIMDSGQVIAEGTPNQLKASIGEHERVRIEFTGHVRSAVEQIRGTEGISDVAIDEEAVVVLADEASRHLPSIINHLAADGVQVGSIDVSRPDLEAVFLHLTGKALRE